jgi:hypothetical protein
MSQALEDIKDRARRITLKRMKEAEDQLDEAVADKQAAETRKRAASAPEGEVVAPKAPRAPKA